MSAKGISIKEQKVFLISDIHGSFKEFEELLKHIPKDCLILFLGDYVDRGANSKKVLYKIMELVKSGKALAIKGNHEELFESFMQYPVDYSRTYLRDNIGGYNTLTSLVDDSIDFKTTYSNTPKFYNEVAKNINENHNELLEFISNLYTYIEMGDYVFVHAGINPDYVDFKQTSKDDFIWIRDKFHYTKLLHNKKVFFGHTPIPYLQGGTVDVIWYNKSKSKFGIDGGCSFGGKLIGVDLNPFNTTLEIHSVTFKTEYQKVPKHSIHNTINI